MWHKADWDKVKEDPSSIHFPRQDWIFEFDAEKHAEEVFDEVVQNRKQAKVSNDAVKDVNWNRNGGNEQV